ncbi:hypothetical protein CD790_28515 [Streptomyces sp. SAJ15]|nr:hypothetical protein CD790_28515 [Streptomyces sp. SAJ15]
MAFCATCAERGSAIYSTLARDDEVQHLNEMLDLVWRAVVESSLDADASSVVEEFEEATEDDTEDEADSPGFYVTQSALLIVNALAVYLNPDPARAAMSGRTLETILSSFDFTLSGEQARLIPAGQESPTGPLQQLEQQEQVAYMSAFADGTGVRITPERMNELRRSCLLARNQYEDAVRQVADLSGWD